MFCLEYRCSFASISVNTYIYELKQYIRIFSDISVNLLIIQSNSYPRANDSVTASYDVDEIRYHLLLFENIFT